MTYKTGKRELIVSWLMKNRENAYSLEEICGAVTDGTGKSTVYRLVSELVDSGLLRRIADGKSRRVTYQYVGDLHCKDHLHLKCMGCGRLIHLDAESSRRVGQTLMGSKSFEIDTEAFLWGRCADCSERSGL